MESQEQSQQPGFTKRPIKPEEQNLIDELARLTEQYGDQFPHICEYVQKEADRIAKGYKSAEEERLLDIEGGKPIRLTFKVSIPIEKYPSFNYVGRLLGPKGSTLRGMQEISGCKLAVLGRGSMKDKEKEAQCRLEGGKFAHLNEDLHVWMQAVGVPDMVFYKLYVACKEVKKYLHADYNDDIFTEQMMVLEQEGGLPKGYTASRGAGRGARGGGTPRGMMAGRGSMTGRGGNMMGGTGMSRGMRGGYGAGNGNMNGMGSMGMNRSGMGNMGMGGGMGTMGMGGGMGNMGSGMGNMGMGGGMGNMGGGMSNMSSGMGNMGGGMGNMGGGMGNMGGGMGNMGGGMGNMGGGMGNASGNGMGMGNMGGGMGMGSMGDGGGMGEEMGLMGMTATSLGTSLKREMVDDYQPETKFARRY